MLAVKPVHRSGASFPSNRLFNDFFERTNGISLPAVNTSESALAFRLEVAAPGLEKSDFQLSIEKDILTIAVNKEYKVAEGETVKRREFGHYAFKRSFQLPDAVDQEKIEASYSQGILVINLPKKEEASPKNIPIV
ncbi:MAG: heat-shock protein [Saprospiraceae bacterium]|nr:MAG: heat-shock protein [Saprospiraceae bacterium]